MLAGEPSSVQKTDRGRWLTRRWLFRAGVAAALAPLAPLLAACDRSGKAPLPPPERRTASAPGVTADTITLGSLYPLSGPASAYAPIVQTMDAYFKKVNDDGGVNGRTIKLVVEDDQYSPPRALPLAKKLVEQDRVFALVGNLGTATTVAIAGYTNEQKVPLLYVISGGEMWGDYKTYPYTLALQPSYRQEARIFGSYIAKTWPGKKIGILYQNDAFGKGYLAYKETAGSSNATVAEETYEATARDVRQQVANLKAKGVEVLILAAIPKPAGLALKAAADQAWKPGVLLSSVSEDPSLFGLAGGAANVEGVVSDNWERLYDDGSPEVQVVKDLLAKYAPQVQFAQFPITGYVIALMTVETLKRAGINPTRESFLAAAESFAGLKVPQLVPGSALSTSKTDRYPVKAVQLARATNGRFVPFGEVIS